MNFTNPQLTKRIPRRFGCGCLATTFIGGGLTGAFVLHTLTLIFDESLNTERGTYAYYLLIGSKIIREFPIVDAVDGPYFYYRSGPGPGANGIYFTSQAPGGVILDKIQDYLSSRGLTLTRSSPLNLRYKGERYELEVSLSKQLGDTIRVSATEFYP